MDGFSHNPLSVSSGVSQVHQAPLPVVLHLWMHWKAGRSVARSKPPEKPPDLYTLRLVQGEPTPFHRTPGMQATPGHPNACDSPALVMQEVLGYPPLSMLVQGESNDSHLTPGMQAKAAVWGRGRLVLTRHQLVIYAAGRQALKSNFWHQRHGFCPESLSLRSQFTLAAGRWLNVRANPRRDGMCLKEQHGLGTKPGKYGLACLSLL